MEEHFSHVFLVVVVVVRTNRRFARSHRIHEMCRFDNYDAMKVCGHFSFVCRFIDPIVLLCTVSTSHSLITSLWRDSPLAEFGKSIHLAVENSFFSFFFFWL